MIAITMDIDWASNELITFALDIFRKHNAKLTIFATHETKTLRDLNEGIFEIGIHPSFNNVEGACGKVKGLMRLYPNARGVRSHSLFQSSYILDIFCNNGLEYDCNLLLPKHKGLQPFVNWNGLIRIPYFWEDGAHMLYGDPWKLDALPMDEPGLKVFNFHPAHIFLNTEKLERYEEAKPYLQDIKKLQEFINPESSGTGARVFLGKLLNYVEENKIATYKLLEIAKPLLRKRMGI